jgi:hypothetical protein
MYIDPKHLRRAGRFDLSVFKPVPAASTRRIDATGPKSR